MDHEDQAVKAARIAHSAKPAFVHAQNEPDTGPSLGNRIIDQLPKEWYAPGYEDPTEQTPPSVRRKSELLNKCCLCGFDGKARVNIMFRGEDCLYPFAKESGLPVLGLAHLLKNKRRAKEASDFTRGKFGFTIEFDERNFLMLCGRKGWEGSCHDAFDKMQVTLVYDEADRWAILTVAGTPYEFLQARRVVLNPRPHKIVIHAHFAIAIGMHGKTLNLKIGKGPSEDPQIKVANNVSPPKKGRLE
jgi:hypothetical protein